MLAPRDPHREGLAAGLTQACGRAVGAVRDHEQEGPRGHLEGRFGIGNPAAYHGGEMSEALEWAVIGARLERELGEPVYDARRLTPAKVARATWAVRRRGMGELVVKVRHGDRAGE